MQLQDKEISLKDSASTHQAARSSIISLLRGVFACPTVGALAELGTIDRMLEGSFDAGSFPSVNNKAALSSVLRYMQSLGLFEAVDSNQFVLTEEGRRILKRSGAFQLLLSYRSYFDHLADLLRACDVSVGVDRKQNVLGSGSLHGKKFFSVVWDMFRSDHPSALIDLGCGNGEFASQACRNWPGLTLALVDLSPIAIEAALARPELSTGTIVSGVVESAEKVDCWIPRIPLEVRKSVSLAVSMWFVVHEFSGGEPKAVVQFFQNIHSMLPRSEIILGEIVSISPTSLAMDHTVSIMPEFLLFHELSGQGVLSWEQWQSILRELPYELKTQVLFDPVGPSAVPSSFVWRLSPR